MSEIEEQLSKQCVECIQQLLINQYGLSIRAFDKQMLKFLHENKFIILSNNDFSDWGLDNNCDYVITPKGMDYIKEIDQQKYGKIDLDSLKCYQSIKYLAIISLCDLHGHESYFYIKQENSLIVASRIETLKYRLNYACNNFLLSKIGSVLKFFKTSISRHIWESIVYEFLVDYIVDHKISFDNSYICSSQKHFLFGNGIAIGLAGEDFLNKKIMEMFIPKLSSMQKEKIDDLLEYIKYFLFEYNDDSEKQAVKNCNYFSVKNKKYIQTFHNNIIYFMLFDKYNSIDNINYEKISIEELELFEMIYKENKSAINYKLKNEDVAVDFRLLFAQIIQEIEQSTIIKKEFKEELFKESEIFTTNYDAILEHMLPNNQIVHLHGSIKDNNIVTGADYYAKLMMMGTCLQQDYWQEYLNSPNLGKLYMIEGDLIIVGYGANYNDEHINAIIRNNPNLKNIIYYVGNETIKKIKNEKYRLVQFLTKFEDEKKLIIKHYDEFYKEYCY